MDATQQENQYMTEQINNIQQESIKNNIVIFGVANIANQKSLNATFTHITNELKINREEHQYL